MRHAETRTAVVTNALLQEEHFLACLDLVSLDSLCIFSRYANLATSIKCCKIDSDTYCFVNACITCNAYARERPSS